MLEIDRMSAATHMRGTIPEFLAEGHTLHLAQSRLELLGFFVMLLAISVFFIGTGYHWFPSQFNEQLNAKLRFMGPLFGLVTLFPFYSLVNAHRKGITLTRTGITDHRISAREIPWLGVESVREGANISSRFIVLKLSNVEDAPPNLLQSLNSRALGLGENERTISAAGLNVSHATLADVVVASWHSARQPRPSPGRGKST
jgi:hypothetical protein